MGCDTIEKLKTKLNLLEMEINDFRKFRDFYNFTFNYAKNPNQKSLGKIQYSVFSFLHSIIYFLYNYDNVNNNMFLVLLLFSGRSRHGNSVLEHRSEGAFPFSVSMV